MMVVMDSAGFFQGGEGGDDASGRGAGSGVDRVESLARCARRITGQINALQAELSGVVAELAEAIDADPEGLGFGFRSLEHRVSHELHLSAAEAKKYLTLGRGLDARPALAEACAAAEFGLQAAEVMARSSEPHTEAKLVEHARNLSTNQLQRTCAAKRRLTDPPPPPVEDHLSITLRPDGRYRVSGDLGPALGSAISEQFADEYGCETPELAAQEAAQLLQAPWPGNVRQLINVAERAILQSRRGTGTISSLLMADNAEVQPTITTEGKPLKEYVEAFERMLIDNTMRRHRGSIVNVMEELSLPRRTLNEKMAKYGLQRADYL